jgi:uncharacterized protein YcfL
MKNLTLISLVAAAFLFAGCGEEKKEVASAPVEQVVEETSIVQEEATPVVIEESVTIAEEVSMEANATEAIVEEVATEINATTRGVVTDAGTVVEEVAPNADVVVEKPNH